MFGYGIEMSIQKEALHDFSSKINELKEKLVSAHPCTHDRYPKISTEVFIEIETNI